MVKKILGLTLALVLMATMCFAEETAAATTTVNIVGKWYVSLLLIDGIAMDADVLNYKMEMDFNADGTGTITQMTKEGTVTGNVPTAWMQDEQGVISFVDQASQVVKTVEVGDDYIIIGDAAEGLLLTTTADGTRNFASTVAAEAVGDFNGKYALAYVSGKDYTLTAEKALSEMATLGVNSTSINIQDGTVELFGEEGQAYTFDAAEGTISNNVNDKIEGLNVKIYKLDNGGIAVNWFGLTFYASAVE